MKPAPYWLTGLFIVQIAVAGLLYFQSEQQRAGYRPAPLLNLTATDVSQLRLTEGDRVVQLKRQGEHWRLSVPSDESDSTAESLPVSDVLVTGVLEKLEALTTTWPVAKTESAQQRFEVSKNLYQRKLELMTDAETKTLYLGTSPGFRKLHARLQDQDEIYALSLNLYEMPAELDYWLDKQLLASKPLTEIEGANVKLILNKAVATAESDMPDKTAELWQFGDAEGEVDQAQANKVASRLQNLHVKGVVTTEVPKTLDWISIKALSDTTAYEWKLAQQQDQYYIQRVDQAGTFTLDAATYEALTAVRKTQFAKAEKVEMSDTLVESSR